MNFENLLRGPISSILGFLIMGVSIWAIIQDKLEAQWEGALVFGLGFTLLFMRDSLPGFIKRIFKKKLKE